MANVKDTRRNFLKTLDEVWPGLAKSFVESMRRVTDQASIQMLEAAIARGDVQAAFDVLRMSSSSLFPLDAAIENAFREGGQYQMAAVGTASLVMPATGRIVASFGGRNPRAERIARDLGAQLVTEVLDDTKTLIAEAVRAGLEAGSNPRTVALDIAGRMVNGTRQGGLVGLHSSQAAYVQNMRAELADPKLMANYFARTARDRRFDSAVRRAMEAGKPLPKDVIDRAAGKYADRLLKLRGETIARTEALRALNAGRDEAMEQLIDRGDISASQVTKKWDATGDSRTRQSHQAADGQTVAKGQPFSVGGHRMKYPGDTSLGAPAAETINCRCYMAQKVDFFQGLK